MSGNKNKKIDSKSHLDMDEYLPYAAHFDEETIITKNGELMQTIKVCGFSYEHGKSEKEQIGDLRSAIRKSLLTNIPADNFSVWVHIVRRQQDIATSGFYKNNFSSKLNEQWVKQNNFRNEYVNELYITIILEGYWMPFKSPKFFIDSLFVSAEMHKRKTILTENAKQLSEIVSQMVQDLSAFGARKLSIYKKAGVYYSEMVTFFSKIMNLKEEEIPLLPRNLCDVLPTHNVEFLINALHVEGPTGRHFGAVFSVKQYSEINLGELDKLIQLPINFIIAECFDFVPKELALKEFDEQKKFFELSGSKNMMKASGLNDIYDNLGDGKSTDFIQQQIIITVIEDNFKEMQKSISKMVDVCRDIGLVVVREDLFVENCYWSMFPANFDFIKRQNFLSIRRSCGFASLANFTTGKLTNNKWGNALTTFRDGQNRPFIFNFHNNDAGNTAIIGDKNTEKNILKNFLISQVQKFIGKTIILESNQESKFFVESAQGKYHQNNDAIKLEAGINGIDISNKNNDDIIKLISDFSNELNKEECNILVIAEEICDKTDENFCKQLEELIYELNSKNTVVIMLFSGLLENNGIFSEGIAEITTNKLFMQNTDIPKEIFAYFGVKEKEIEAIKNLSKDSGEILLKRAGDSLKINFKLSEESAEYKILSSTTEFVDSVKEAVVHEEQILVDSNLNEVK
jgi:type IV secretion system protein VirB4